MARLSLSMTPYQFLLAGSDRRSMDWTYADLMGVHDLDSQREIELQRQRIEEQRKRRREQIEVVAPQVDARVKAWAEADPLAYVGEWRNGRRFVETNPFNPGSGTPITALELARYTIVFSQSVDDEVFAFCDEHQTGFSAGIQSAAREQSPEHWCPSCTTDPTWPPGVRDPAVVAAERVAERDAHQQRIDQIKASRKNRITKTTQIATARGVITDQQADQLLAIWNEIQSPGHQ